MATDSNDLPITDRRLRETPRLQPLRELLERGGSMDPTRLAQVLGCPLGEEMGLVQVLTLSKLITDKEMQAAKERKRNDPDLSLWQALRDLGFLGEETMAAALAMTARLPLLAFQPGAVDGAVVRHWDGRTANRWEAFPVGFQGEALLLAVADPKLIDVEEAAGVVSRPIKLGVAKRSTIMQAIHHWYGAEGQKESAVIGELDLRGIPPIGAEESWAATAAGTPLAMLVNQIILKGVLKQASDIHITPDERFLAISFRLDGQLHPQGRLPLAMAGQLVSRLKVVAGMDISEKRLPQDGKIRVRLPDRYTDIRVSCVPAIKGETMVLRLLDLEVGLVKLEELGFFPADQERMRRAISLPYGLILVTGPTGSGKSTTMRAALEFIQQLGLRHILTVEDPVEVKLSGVTQVQVHEKIGFNFARALRHFLRHDPDVMMVGEIRDGETARIAVQAALTGHLVLSTLHTNDAASAVTRLQDIGVEPYLVSSAVTLVIAQRLVRGICPACRQPYQPDEKEQATLRAMGLTTPVKQLWLGSGCPQCTAGYKGRTVIYEMLPLDDELKGMVARQESAVAIRLKAREKGFQPLLASGLRKVVEGRTTLAEVAVYLDTLDGFG